MRRDRRDRRTRGHMKAEICRVGLSFNGIAIAAKILGTSYQRPVQ